MAVKKKKKSPLRRFAKEYTKAVLFGPRLIAKGVKKVVKRVSCVEKGKKMGLTHREAVKFCAGSKMPEKFKAKPPSKIRR